MSFGELDWVPEVPYPDSGNRFKITQLFYFKSMEPKTIEAKSPQEVKSNGEIKKIRRRRKRKSHLKTVLE